MTVPTLLAAALVRDAARPALTYYDDSTGERVELSVATLDNWVAKTANFLVDDLAAEPGERVAVLLPAHWQTAAVLLACWSAGLVTVTGTADQEPGPDLAFASAENLPAALGLGARDVVGLSLRPLGGSLREPAGPALDYAAEVPRHGDRFAPPVRPDAGAPALELAGERLTASELAAAARAAATRWHLGVGDRVLSVLPYDTLDGLLAGLLAPLAAGAGAVLCRRLDAAALPRRVATERVTAVAGVPAPAESIRLLVPPGPPA